MEDRSNYVVNIKNVRVVLVIGIMLMILGPIILIRPSFLPVFNFSQSGEIGDTIGGITAPIVNLLGALLVYYSFLAQQKANALQFDSLKSEIDFNQRFSNYTLVNNLLDEVQIMLEAERPALSFMGGTIRDCLAFFEKERNTIIESKERKIKDIFYAIKQDFEYIEAINNMIDDYSIDAQQSNVLVLKLDRIITGVIDINTIDVLKFYEKHASSTSIKNSSTKLIMVIQRSKLL